MKSAKTFTIKFYGTRGSIPVCDQKFQKYGGNTTCIQVKGTNENVLGIIDAGTGIRNLGKDLLKSHRDIPKEILIGFTHFHWDHIQGFPFFDPAYDPSFRINIIALGINRGIDNLREIFETQMRSEFFPIPLEKMGARFEFIHPKKEFDIFSNTHVTAVKHNHPGGAFSYKLEQDGKSIVISTDIEHGDSLDDNIIKLAMGADVLIHDAQYTTEELVSHKGWGHSSYDQAIEVTKLSGVKQLILTHHSPDHDDSFLDKMENYCRNKFPNCTLAKEGMEIEV